MALVLTVVGCAPAPRWIAVATSDGSVLFFDPTLRGAGAAHLPLAPMALDVSGDGTAILAGGSTGAGSGMVAWLRRSDRRVLAAHATAGPVSAMSLDREGNEALVLTAGSKASLDFLSTSRLAPTRSLPVCSHPVALSFTREGDRVYVTCDPGSVVEVDPGLEMIVQTVLVGTDSGRACGAGRGGLSANGTLLFVPCSASGQILYLDRVTLRPWDSVFVARGVRALAVTPEAVAVALLPDSNRLALVDLRRKRRLASISLASQPLDVALSANGRRAFVLAAGRGGREGALWKLDLPGGAMLARAAIPSGGRVVYVWPGRRESRMRWVSLPPSPEAPQQ